MKAIIPGTFILFFIFGCTTPSKTSLPFDFNNPEEMIKLPQTLHEISGISFYKKNELACVQDEKGVIYFYNIKKDKLRNNVQFDKDKDYEGITNVNDTLYVLCSNGVISEVDSLSETGYAHDYNTFLSKANNCEGLCFDPRGYRLLVACKGKPEKKTASKGMKAVYGFNLSDKKLEKTPAYIIDPDSVKKVMINTETGSLFENLFSSNDETKEFQFEPSDISIDPVSNDVYILSSVGKTLLVLTYEGKIKFAIHLDSRIFKQPEGITFASDGTMYISDEGRGGKANLIKIKRTIS